MVTHECPEEIAKVLFSTIPVLGNPTNGGKLDHCWSSRTRQAFQSMWSAHSPDIWIFGHWHLSFDQIANGTRFICLSELEYRDMDI
jgi:hypothetical protein